MPAPVNHKNVKMDVDDFLDVFKPVQNHLSSEESWNGCMFETFGPELDYVQNFVKTHPDQVWTISDVDGRQIISNGMTYVNRMGFFITEKAAAPNTFYEITDPDDEEEDDED